MARPARQSNTEGHTFTNIKRECGDKNKTFTNRRSKSRYCRKYSGRVSESVKRAALVCGLGGRVCARRIAQCRLFLTVDRGCYASYGDTAKLCRITNRWPVDSPHLPNLTAPYWDIIATRQRVEIGCRWRPERKRHKAN